MTIENPKPGHVVLRDYQGEAVDLRPYANDLTLERLDVHSAALPLQLRLLPPVVVINCHFYPASLASLLAKARPL